MVFAWMHDDDERVEMDKNEKVKTLPIMCDNHILGFNMFNYG